MTEYIVTFDRRNVAPAGLRRMALQDALETLAYARTRGMGHGRILEVAGLLAIREISA